MIKKYRKKPVVIEAYQYFDSERNKLLNEHLELIGNWDNNPMTPDKVSIKTLEGYLNVSNEDFIIKGVKGEFYPIKEFIFKETYEEV